MRRRTFLTALTGLVAGARTASAQSYPARPVRIIVPFGPGGPADVYARILGQHLQAALGQPFVVENRTGGGGVNGTIVARQSPADGYTLLMMSNTQTANETLVPTRGYELMRDFAPIAPVNSSDLVIVVNNNVAANTLQEFLALARARPGQLNYASSGNGTPYHMAGELFKSMSRTDITHVPYRNSGAARADVIAGHAQMMIDAVSATGPAVIGGQVRALATTGRTRTTILPNVPTATEAGLPGYEATIWLGLMAPRGTPQDIVTRLNEAINGVMRRPEIQREWAAQGVTSLVMSPAEFESYLRADIEKWANVIRTANIRAE